MRGLTAIFVVLASLAPAAPALATFPGANGRIAFEEYGVAMTTRDADGSNVRFVNPDANQPVWSADGNRIAYSTYSAPNQLWTMAADGSDQQLVTSLGDFIQYPAWSPDGSKIAVVSNAASCGDGNVYTGQGVFVVDVATGHVTNISASLPWSAGATWCRLFTPGLSWSPDGQTVVASTGDTAEAVQEYRDATLGRFPADLVAIDVDTRTETNLTWDTDPPYYEYWYPDFSPDGGQIVSTIVEYGEDLQVAEEGLRVTDANGAGQATLLGPPPGATLPRWTPDGTSITFALNNWTTGAGSLWRIDAAGGVPQHMFTTNGAVLSFDWQAMPSGDVSITTCDDPSLTTLTSVAGNLTLDLPDGCRAVDLPALVTIGGDVILTGSPSLTELSAPVLTNVGGDFAFICAPTLTSLDLPQLQDIDGAMTMTETSVSTLSMPALESAGAMTITENPTLTTAGFPSLTTAGGDMTLTANPTITTVDTPALTTAGGDMTFTANPTLTSIAMPLLSTVAGDMEMTGDAAVTTIDCATGGSQTTTHPGSFVNVSLPSITTIGGDATIETQQPTLDLTAATVGGDLSVTGDGTTSVAAMTAEGGTALQLDGPTASMTAHLVDGTFTDNVGFNVGVVPPSSLVEASGLDAEGGDATVTPMSAYTFNFDVPSLGIPASLAFELDLAALSDAVRADVVAALESGLLTVAVKDDADGSTFEAVAVCTATETPAVDGCVTLHLHDADRQPVANAAEAAFVRLEAVAAHFSTWAVAVVEPVPAPPVLDVTVDSVSPGAEGTAISVAGAATGGSVATTLSWTATPAAAVDSDATCVFADPSSATTTVICDDDGMWTLRLTATDDAVSDFAETTLDVTNAAPEVVITSPANGSTHDAGTAVTLTASVTDAGANDTATCAIEWGDGTTTTAPASAGECTDAHAYATAAEYVISMTASDDEGAGGTPGTVHATVVDGAAYALEGFFAPVDNRSVNVMKSGATAPIKFRVRTGDGNLVTDTAVVAVTSGVRRACETGQPLDALEQYATGGTSLRYDSAGEQFVFNWQSPSNKAGACYDVVIELIDGTSQMAQFSLR